MSPLNPGIVARTLRGGIVTGITDGLFSSVLVIVFYHSTFARLWQGVASVLIGSSAIDGGAAPVAIGLLMHFGVATAWSFIFLLLVDNIVPVKRLVASPNGLIKTAVIFGPVIWMTMSLVLIPSLTHRPPSINFRWWVQFIGHIPFVAVPIIAAVRRGR